LGYVFCFIDTTHGRCSSHFNHAEAFERCPYKLEHVVMGNKDG